MNNPVMYTDPKGHTPACWEWLILVLALAGGIDLTRNNGKSLFYIPLLNKTRRVFSRVKSGKGGIFIVVSGVMVLVQEYVN